MKLRIHPVELLLQFGMLRQRRFFGAVIGDLMDPDVTLTPALAE